MDKKMKKMLRKTQLIFTSIIIVGFASFLSYSKFSVVNPFASLAGVIKVTFLNENFVEVQKSPKVIFFNPDYGIERAMEDHGYTFLADEKMGSLMVFERNNVREQGIGHLGGIISFLIFEAE